MADPPLPLEPFINPSASSWIAAGNPLLAGAPSRSIARVTQSAGWVDGGVGARITHAVGGWVGGGFTDLQCARMPPHPPASRGSHYPKFEL